MDKCPIFTFLVPLLTQFWIVKRPELLYSPLFLIYQPLYTWHIHTSREGAELLIRTDRALHDMSVLSQSYIDGTPSGIIWGSVSCPRALQHTAGAINLLMSGKPDQLREWAKNIELMGPKIWKTAIAHSLSMLFDTATSGTVLKLLTTWTRSKECQHVGWVVGKKSRSFVGFGCILV